MTATTCPNCGYDHEALHSLTLGDLRLDYDGAIVLWRGKRVKLNQCERLILIALARADGAPIRRAVLAEITGYGGDNGDNITAVHLCRMKEAFRAVDPAFDRFESVRGRGVRWRVE